MKSRYTLEWLDLLITATLNPKKINVSTITDEQIHTIITDIQKEKAKLQLLLENQVFGMTKKKQIKVHIKQYHSTLIILLDQALENQKLHHSKNASFKDLYDAIISCLDELLSFIEMRFHQYLSLDERIPLTYLAVSQKELRQKLNRCKNQFTEKVDSKLTDIVFNTLHSFTDNPNNRSITFREVLYKKELVKELETLEDAEKETALNELLLYMNFNSKAYMTYFTRQLTEKINAHEDYSTRLDLLLFHSKKLNQMLCKEGVALFPKHANLKNTLSNWFSQEIFYLEKKLHLNVVPLNENGRQSPLKKNNEREKILCKLSVDQMALVLRSVNDLKIVLANSMNNLFKSIVPYLSTPQQKDISYDSMRSKSYVAETRDKEIAIQTLEQMIKKIKDY